MHIEGLQHKDPNSDPSFTLFAWQLQIADWANALGFDIWFDELGCMTLWCNGLEKVESIYAPTYPEAIDIFEQWRSQFDAGKRTPEEVGNLMWDWKRDPIWDIEHSDGFEYHYDELLNYRLTCEVEWQAKQRNDVTQKAAQLGCSLDTARYIMRLEYRIEQLEMLVAGI